MANNFINRVAGGISSLGKNIAFQGGPSLNKAIVASFERVTGQKILVPENSEVNVSIYNIKGQMVRTLLNDNREKGIHDVVWKSKDSNGNSVASGIYFYKFEVNGKTKGLKKMLLLK